MKWKDIRDEHLEYWLPVINELNLPDKSWLFSIKKVYNEGNIMIYNSEMKHSYIFIEIIDSSFNTLNPRKLYIFKVPEDFKNKYTYDSDKQIWHIKHSDLEEIVLDRKDVIESEMSKKEDIKIMDMTVRDLIAILTKNPVSKKEWINELLKTM